MTNFICFPRRYKYKKWTFEFNPNLGPCPLKKNGEYYKRTSKAFWEAFEEFRNLTLDEREKCRVSGGCIPW